MARMADSDLIAFVTRLAPEVDRLFIAGHRAAAPLARDVRERIGLPRTVLIDLRTLLLSAAGMTLEEAAALERYQDLAHISTLIEEHVKHGLLRREGRRIHPTAVGRDILLRLTDTLAQAVAALWPDERDTAAAACTANAVIERAKSLPPHRYPAFSAESVGYLPRSPSPAMALWSSLSGLRYLRADAHALAWLEAGLTVQEIEILTALRYKLGADGVTTMRGNHDAIEGPILAALEALQARGWVTDSKGQWILTVQGREARTMIERRTNELNAPPYAAITPDTRDLFLTFLRGLKAQVP
jgi:hypothetical protein